VRNDYTDSDKFHDTISIKEVCLKKDEEGIFYFCQHHDPEGPYKERRDYGFAENIERYQPFKNIDIRLS